MIRGLRKKNKKEGLPETQEVVGDMMVGWIWPLHTGHGNKRGHGSPHRKITQGPPLCKAAPR